MTRFVWPLLFIACGAHPWGYQKPDNHGTEAKLQVDNCTECHGVELTGGTSEVSCNTCHDPGWREDCTFCHGGDRDDAGAPPVYIDGSFESEGQSFEAHSEHVLRSETHEAIACQSCHEMPQDILFPGHIFIGDTTPGAAEVVFTEGLSPDADWNRNNGTCDNLYCHSSGGEIPGQALHTDQTDSCDLCHAGPDSVLARVRDLGGQHREHESHDVQCFECHGSTIGENGRIINASGHVNGTVDVQMPDDEISLDSLTCEGSCHGERHRDRDWLEPR
ncbi:MAG: putative CxxxxCH...CXXCH cytochrome family protein [Myxococcota bacterium]|jgi:predicted CxxxxCH...CXXCH cytochrome family protein